MTYIASSDPSQVDTATLFLSVKRDLREAGEIVRTAKNREAFDWIAEALSTIAELERRNTRAEALPAPATGAQAEIRGPNIVISLEISALPLIVSGSIADRNLQAPFIVTDPQVFAKDVCAALNAENERGETSVHRMFDAAFDDAVDQGAEGVETCTDVEFEAHLRQQQQALALTAPPRSRRRDRRGMG